MITGASADAVLKPHREPSNRPHNRKSPGTSLDLLLGIFSRSLQDFDGDDVDVLEMEFAELKCTRTLWRRTSWRLR
jgi:hypothetical protein